MQSPKIQQTLVKTYILSHSHGRKMQIITAIKEINVTASNFMSDLFLKKKNNYIKLKIKTVMS